jgi:predicted amidohydrolase YtcJ
MGTRIEFSKPTGWKARATRTCLVACCGFVVVFPLLGAESSAPADLILTGGNIVTLAAGDSIAQAVAIRQGRIVAVGSDREVQERAGPATTRIDLGGKTVLPGLYESHVHALQCSRAYLRDPYEELGSIAEIQSWLRRRARDVPAGEWIRIPRNEITRLKEKRHPTVAELDAACTTHPVVFEAVKKYVFNTRGFAELGIAADAKSLPDATLIPGADGRPQFLIPARTAIHYAARFAARDTATAAEKREALLKLHRAYHSVGITTIFERGSPVEDYREYEKLAADGLLAIRTRFTLMYPYRSGSDMERFMRERNVRPGMGDEWLSARTIKIIADGGIHWGTTRLSEPYGPRRLKFYVNLDPNYQGELNYSIDEMTGIFAAAARAGWQMVVHITGDEGTNAVLQAMEKANAATPLTGRRFTLTHSYFPTEELARRLAALGMCVDTQTYTYHRDAEFIADIYGRDWAQRFIGLGTWSRAGVPVAINSDHMVGYDPNHAMNSYNPFLALYVAVSRRSDAGRIYEPDQKLSRLDALRAVTSTPAYLDFEENKSGSIEPGKYADLVVIDRDYLQCPEEQIREIKVVRTIVNGRTVYEASR